MRLLVTGSRGFLGSHLAEHLRRTHPSAKLFLLDHRPGPGLNACDLEDVEATTKLLRRLRPTIILHLAGRGASRDSWEKLWKANLDATRGLLEAVRALPNASEVGLVIAGSAAEYGVPTRRGPVVESDPLNALTPYGAVKRAQFLLASSYGHLGLRIIWARIFNVVGPGMPDSLALGSFARQIALAERGRQGSVRVGNLGALRDYIDARDVARALDLLARRGKPGEVYNVCSGKAWPMSALLDRMIAMSPRPVAVVKDAARIKRGEVQKIVGSYRKLNATTGWKPRVAIETSLRDTLEWHRTH